MTTAQGESPPRILFVTLLEPRDEIEDKLIKCYSYVSSLTSGLSEREANDVLNSQVSKGQTQHEDVQLGLFYSILISTDPQSSSRLYRDVTFCSRDGLSIVVMKASQIVFEKWTRVNDNCRHQLIWLIRELVKNSIIGTEGLVQLLLRQIAGGDIMAKNMWLVENILDTFIENRPWLDKLPMLIALAVYTYLRVIADHFDSKLAALRQKEVDFTVSLLQDKWNDCLLIGRDLIRLLQAVARIPEFEQVWRQILHSPTSLHPQFTGIMQLMSIRTQRKFLVSRLTPDMENKLFFLTTKVKFGNHKRYQDWFQRQYLSTAESQSLRYDLIRFICACVHPTNDMLQSDIIPRWAVIGWLLTSCTSNVAASNAKLALFYDWLFFEKDRDNIMNIEPGILVMYHSIKSHLPITATLLDFLCRIMVHFFPPLTNHIKQGVYASLRSIMDKRVLPSLAPLFDNAKLDRELRATIKDSFFEFCNSDGQDDIAARDAMQLDLPSASLEAVNTRNVFEDRENGFGSNNCGPSLFKPIDLPPVSPQPLLPSLSIPSSLSPSPSRSVSPPPVTRPTPTSALPAATAEVIAVGGDSEQLEKLNRELKTYILELQNERDRENQCEIMDKLIQAVLEPDDFDPEGVGPLALTLCNVLESQMQQPLLPEDICEDSLEESIGSPLYVIFRNLSQLPEDSYNRDPLLQLLGEMYKHQPSIGYRILYFLKIGKVRDDKMQTYKDLHLNNIDARDFKTSLLADMKLCQEADMRLFTFLLTDVFTQFPSQTMGNVDFLHLIVSTIDGSQLQDIICQILQGHLVMFKKESLLSVLNESLAWETLEQYFLWQLILAHDISPEQVLPLLPKLEFKQHAEAMTSLLIMLKRESLSADIVRLLLCREPRKGDFFTISLLKHWAQENEDKLAEILHNFLTKFNATPRKKPRPTTKKEQPSVDNILAHLDFLRQTCKNISFLTNETIQEALRQVQMTCGENQKSQYSELLALIEDDIEEIPSKRNLRLTAARRANNASPKGSGSSSHGVNKKKYTDSSDDSSDDDFAKPQAKKRKSNSGAAGSGGAPIILEDSD